MLVEDIERALWDGALSQRKAVMHKVVAEIRARDCGPSSRSSRVPIFGPPYGWCTNWTVLENMPAGRKACAPSERSSREASASGIPKVQAPMKGPSAEVERRLRA